MLLYVSAENYRSIGEKQEMTFTPNKDNSHENNILGDENNRAIAVAPIYGGNATGKTNVLRIIDTIKNIITSSKEIYEYYSPCKFTEKENTDFEIIFVKNKIKYYYKIKYNFDKILEEKLYYYPGTKVAKIFEREDTIITFGSYFKALEKYKKDFSNKISYITFIQAMVNESFEEIKDVYNFFLFDLLIIGLEKEKEDISKVMEKFSDVKNDEEIRNFLTSFYSHMNIGVKSIEYIPLEAKLEEIFRTKEKDSYIKGLENILNTPKNEINLIYQLGRKEIRISLENESKGIQKIFTVGIHIANALVEGKVILFDELEISFHPLLSRKIIELFHSNKTNAQLIFTTHDTNLLDLKLFRRDQIYFTARTEKTNFQTQIKSLIEIPNIRKTTNIKKGYLEGKYCQLPTFDTLGLGD